MSTHDIDGEEQDHEGSALESPRLQFYLRHREMIQTWAALKSEVREATSELLLDLRDDLATELLARDPTAVVRADAVGTRWPRLALVRPDWPVHQGEAIAAVALEWTPKVDPAGSERPYHGIRVERKIPLGQDLNEVLRPIVQDSGLFTPGYSVTGWWIALRYIDRDAQWWTDLALWRRKVIDAVMSSWDVGADLVDRALTRMPSPPADSGPEDVEP